jgi:uncharacterized protein YndB with AHSA1/START domain
MEDSFVVEIDIDAPPARVWQAWTDPQERLAWWGDDATYRGTSMQSDLRVGGRWRTEGRSASGQSFTVWGEYTRVDPPRALGFTWSYDWAGPEAAPTHVLVELMPAAGGTHVRLTHSGFRDAAARDSHRQGWPRVFAWLSAWLASQGQRIAGAVR